MSRKQLLITILSASLLSALLLIVVLISFPNPPTDGNTSPSLKDPVVAEMISKINESNIYNTVYGLQAFTTRRLGTTGNTEARTYLFNRLSSIPGLNVEYQSSYDNIIATLPGTDASSNEIYIVGGHYDSKVYPYDPKTLPAPGATDNGGGAALIVELARVMSEYKFDHTIEFALWNGEEDGTLGSAQYAPMARSNNLNISLYLNLDAACYNYQDQFVLDIMWWNLDLDNGQAQWVSDMMTEHNTLYGIGFTLTYNVNDCTSDHRPFWERGYTAVAPHQGGADAHGWFVHSASDTVDKIDTLYAKKDGQLAMSVLARLAEVQDIKPPVVSILSPENRTYSYGDVPLIIAIDEAASWMGFCLDKQVNQSITGNTTLSALPDGVHAIVVYANDTAGNMGVSTPVYFTVHAIPLIESITLADGPTNIDSAIVTLTLTVEGISSATLYSSQIRRS